jgi:N utilization substance protein B
MRSPNDPRHIARILAIMDLYAYFFGKDFQNLGSLDTDELEIGNYSKKVRSDIIDGVKESHSEIDEIINKYSDPVKSSDLNLILLQILRAEIFEGFIAKKIPPKVAVDEAIELTRDFGMEDQVKKVAGIMGKIYDNLVKDQAK